jgi:hypothetical protein
LIASIKAFFSLLGILDFFAGLIEKAQMRAAIRAEDANEDFEALAEQLRKDKDLAVTIRNDHALRARLRRRYTAQRPLSD